MEVWFEDSNEIECSLERVKNAFENIGELYVGVAKLMPGLSQAKLEDQGDDWIIIKFNEIVIKRTNIIRRIETESVVVESNEEYRAGKMVTTKGRFLDEFTTTQTGIKHRVIISDVKAPGFLGFFYRKFCGSETGKIQLQSYKRYLETK